MTKELVYFIAHDSVKWRAAYPVIKIGRTSDLPARVSALSTGSPVSLVVAGSIIDGDAFVLEKHFHKKFQRARLSGEWFELSWGMVAAIRQYSIIDDRFDELFDLSPTALDEKDLEIEALRNEIIKLNREISDLKSELKDRPKRTNHDLHLIMRKVA